MCSDWPSVYFIKMDIVYSVRVKILSGQQIFIYLAARPSLELKPLQVFFLFLLFFCSTDRLTITRDGAMENEIFCCDDLINYAKITLKLDLVEEDCYNAFRNATKQNLS